MRRVVGWLGSGLLLVVAASAQAQTYPPTAPTTTPATDVEVRGFGVVRAGQGFTKRDCGFAPGGTVGLALNGNGAGAAAAGSDGCVELDVEAVGTDTVAIDGRRFAVRCGGQAIDVSGPAAGGGQRTVRNTFTLSCETARGLTATGASTARWSAVGFGLVALGAAFVLADRRRRPRGREG